MTPSYKIEFFKIKSRCNNPSVGHFVFGAAGVLHKYCEVSSC